MSDERADEIARNLAAQLAWPGPRHTTHFDGCECFQAQLTREREDRKVLEGALKEALGFVEEAREDLSTSGVPESLRLGIKSLRQALAESARILDAKKD